MVRLSAGFVRVFVDTLHDDATTQRFHESQGSYPVLRVLDLDLSDLAPRLDGNPVAGAIPLGQVKQQLRDGFRAFASRPQ
ncbi:MAG: hypothetical protein ACYCW6_15085 [Candidatus Xenobia bacterium]